jgi:Tol biopolymer transport system component
VIAAILEREPAPLEVARPLDRVVRRSLAKDPDQRFQTARDLKTALSWALEQQPQVNAPSRSRLGWVAAVLAVIGIAGWAAYWRASRPTEQMLKPLVRLDVSLGPEVSLGSVSGTDVILSPDGTRLVYVSQGRLFTRLLNQPKTTELAGTEGAFAPFFSPDGQWVAFFAQAKLKKVSVDGGAPISVSEAGGFARGGSWGEDGNIVFALSVTSALSRVPSSGGTPTPLTELAQGEVTHRWPQVLPGSKAVLFTAASSANGSRTANIEVMSLGSHHRKTLQRGGTFGRYLPSGHLVYVNSGTLFAVPFDLDRLEVHGTPSPVLQDIAISTANGHAQLDFSRTGTLVYRNGGAGSQVVNVRWLRASGQTEPLLPKAGVYFRPRVSPDGKRLVLGVAAGSDEDIWAYELQRGTRTRLTFGGGANVGSVWSPDGRYILFRVASMFWTRSDGASKPQPLTQSKNIQNPWSFTPDGKRLAFWEQDARTQGDLWTMAMESNGDGLQAGKREVFLQTPADERYPCFSPDGKWLAYTSDDSGIYQIYVEAFPRKGGRWQISDNGGTYPVWSRNGRELFFRTSDSRIMVATYTAKGASFVPDKPRLWSDTRLADFGTVGIATYDLAPDGERIAAIMPAETAEAQQARNHVVLLNFFDEVRRRVPTGTK